MSDTFCARRLSLRWLRWAVLVVVAGAAGIGVSGCGAEKDVSGQQRQVQVRAENLAKQRESVLALIANHPDVEVIRFTQEGDRPGLGAPWSANAVVTIGGKDYQEILGPRSRAGESLPDAPPSSSPRPVTVIYSDGSSEVLG